MQPYKDENGNEIYRATYKEISEAEWVRNGTIEHVWAGDTDHILLGCLQRIADALELANVLETKRTTKIIAAINKLSKVVAK